MHVTEPVRATIPVQNGARLSWDPWIYVVDLDIPYIHVPCACIHMNVSSSVGSGSAANVTFDLW